MPDTKSPPDTALTRGPVVRAVWLLAWPTLIQNLISNLQGVIDHIMVGHYVGYRGNAAIGVSWQLFFIVIVFIASVHTGMGVLVARCTGAGDAEKVNRIVYQAALVAVFIFGGLLAPLGYFLAPDLLRFVQTAPEVMQEARPYLRTLCLLSPGMLLFYILSGSLRAAGDAKTPLKLGILMTLLNLILNFILIRGLGPIPSFRAQGAALGTAISAILVSGLTLFMMYRGALVIRFKRNMGLGLDRKIIRSIFHFGLPTGLQGIAMNLGGVMLFRFVGSLPQSAEAHAAYTVGYTQLFSIVTLTSLALMSAASTVVGQSLGARRMDRVRQVPIAAAGIGATISIPVGMTFLVAPEALLGLFNVTEPPVLELGRQLLVFIGGSGVFLAIALSYTGALFGTGDTRSPLYITLLTQLALPVGICGTLSLLGSLEPIHIWSAIVVSHVSRCLLSIARFHQGHWRQIRVDI